MSTFFEKVAVPKVTLARANFCSWSSKKFTKVNEQLQFVFVAGDFNIDISSIEKDRNNYLRDFLDNF